MNEAHLIRPEEDITPTVNPSNTSSVRVEFVDERLGVGPSQIRRCVVATQMSRSNLRGALRRLPRQNGEGNKPAAIRDLRDRSWNRIRTRYFNKDRLQT